MHPHSRKLLKKLRCDNTTARVNAKLHGTNLPVDILHELDDKVNELVLEHRLCMCVGYEKRQRVSLHRLAPQHHEPARGAGYQDAVELLPQNKAKMLMGRCVRGCDRNRSARCMRNRMNFATRTSSSSSACFTRIDTLTEFTAASICTHPPLSSPCIGCNPEALGRCSERLPSHSRTRCVKSRRDSSEARVKCRIPPGQGADLSSR